MAKNINIKLAVKDQFTQPLKRASKSTRAMDMQIKRTQRSLQKFANSAKASMAKVAKSAGIMATAGAAAAGVFLKQSVDAAKVQIEQETKLQAVLMNTNGMRLDQIESIKKYAGALQNVGVVGDEVALAGVQQLGSYQLQAKALKKLMPGMNDLLVQQKGLNASTGDAVNIGNMLGKVMTGQFGALSRAGINFTDVEMRAMKMANQEERAAILAKILQKNVGGTNKAMAETDQGRIKQVANAYGDMQEVVGKLVLPYLARLASWFKQKIPIIEGYMIKLEGTISKVFEAVTPYIEAARTMLGNIAADAMPAVKAFGKLAVTVGKTSLDIAEKVAKNWDRIAPVIYTVVGAMAAYKTITVASAAYTYAMITAQKIKASWDAFGAGKLTIMTAAQWAYNVALNANPIGLVVTAIGALVAAGVALYKNWDIVTAKCKQLWNKVTDLWERLDRNPVTKVAKTFLTMCNPIYLATTAFKAIGNNWDLIKSKCLGLLDTVKGFWAALDNNPITRFGKQFLTMLSPIHRVIEAFDALGNVWDGVKGAWDYIMGDDEEEKTTATASGGSQADTAATPPRHALGTEYFQGGATRINEGGRGEMAVLPSGSQILSHNNAKAATAGGPSVNVHLTVQGNLLGNESFMEECGEYLSQKILEAIKNI